MDVKELIGVTFGNCTIERIIGRGGMGAVFLAQQSRPVRTVAVKVLIPAPGFDAEQQRTFFERFRREADTLAKLEHKNILPIYEYDEALVDGQRLAYLVMPFIRGGTLRERIDEMKRAGQQFDLNTVDSYISQVADALSYAHSFGVIHRDIKPGNLLFHQDGRLLLSDFGIVRLVAMPSLTTAGNFLGTAEYASPEQVSSRELDPRSDIYSLGIILYELLTGNVPFTGPNHFAVMSKQLNDPVPSIRNSRPDLSPAIEFVVKKALAKNPVDRYQSATEMAADLHAAISPVLAVPAGLRLQGDARNDDPTMADRSWQPSPPLAAAVPVGHAERAIPPTSPAIPVGGVPRPNMGAQFVAPPQQVPPWPNRGAQFAAPAEPLAPPSPTYRQGRRLIYYGAMLIALLLQFPVLILLDPTRKAPLAFPDTLGVLLGTGINLLALAAVGFVGVTRGRNFRRIFSRSLVVALIAPLLSGFFISYGVIVHSSDLYLPVVSYVVLVLSNIYIIRQLGRVDVREQFEAVPVLWRSALVGALTGLLPLTIILIIALITPALLQGSSLLLRMFLVLSIILIGAPTPGAMMAVWLSDKMTFPVLLRSSAIAGMLMFFGASLLVALWGFLTSSYALFYYHFNQPVFAFLVIVGLLGAIGFLRGMLDAWVYRRILARKVKKQAP
ncbi:MAG TPA: serine/threonine-protein kinase [Ktedonobacteraceae bacterium]|nr:serine/threonine-protein kinase [Ktedonobacteraceae bacterium]